MDHPVVTKIQAAALLHISVGTLDGLMHRRELPFIKMPRKVLFRVEDLDAFLEARLIQK
jgi:excisionase family DNA binding protein